MGKSEFGSVGTGGYRAAQTVDKRALSVGVADRWTSVVIDSSSIPTEEFLRDFEVLQFQRDDRMGQNFDQLPNTGVESTQEAIE